MQNRYFLKRYPLYVEQHHFDLRRTLWIFCKALSWSFKLLSCCKSYALCLASTMAILIVVIAIKVLMAAIAIFIMVYLIDVINYFRIKI
ncbi:hypothetical protein BDF19DRAFT_439377, partial [Syncephalis fuscata]